MDEMTKNNFTKNDTPLSSSPFGGGQGGGYWLLSLSLLFFQRGKFLLFFSFVIVTLSVGCTNYGIKFKKKTDLYWYVQIPNNKQTFRVDTFMFDKILKAPNDFLVDSLNFTFKKKKHCLRLFSNFYNNNDAVCTRIDLEFYKLDSIGVIYSKGVNGRKISKLISTNDSINRLINFSIREIKRNKSWFKFVSPIKETIMNFPSPIISN